MGLLSDPEYGSVKWVKVLKKVHRPASYLCYLGAIAWFIMLGNRDFNNETYFSENALLPGLVTNEFSAEASAKQFLNEFEKELMDKYSDSDDMPIAWLVGKMSQLHLEVHTHNFSLKYPIGLHEQTFVGTNVYGILRAPRTSSLEAIVISAPYRTINSHQKGTAAGIALMLAFAQFARPQKYWAKDIIFLVTQHEQLGMQAWLEAYHGLQSDAETFYTSLGSYWSPGTFEFGNLKAFSWGDHQKCLNPGKLKGRSGSIQAAINLEFHTPKIKYVEVKVEGLNGQLPNLDLVNLVHKLCVKSGIHHSYKNSFSWMRTRNKMDEWAGNLWTMVGMLTEQVAGVPNGNHGLFHRFNVEAVTLEGRDGNDPGSPKVRSLGSCNFHRLGVALESVLRSLNNLLERFHQSYFFYVLAATNRFISIGQYMPTLCLMCVAMLIRALYLWVSIQQDEEDADEQTIKKKNKQKRKQTNKTDKQSDSEDKVLGDDEKETVLRNRRKDADREKVTEDKLSDSEIETDSDEKEVPGDKKPRAVADSSMSVVNIGANYLLVHLIGFGVMNTPVYFAAFGARYNLLNEKSIYYGLIATSILIAIISPFLPCLLRRRDISREEITLVNILLLVELATVCLTVGMQNFALGLAVALVCTPLALFISVSQGSTSRMRRVLKRVTCLVLHPLSVLSLGMVGYSRALFPEDAALAGASRGTDAAMQAVMFSIVDSMIYGNWVFNVVTSVILPVWILFWQLCNTVVVK